MTLATLSLKHCCQIGWIRGQSSMKSASSTNATLGNISRLNLGPLAKLFQILTTGQCQFTWIAQMSSSTTAECGRFYFREHCQDFPQTRLTFHARVLLRGTGRLSGNVGSAPAHPKIDTDNPGDTLKIASHFRSTFVVTLLILSHWHWHWYLNIMSRLSMNN